MSEEQISRTRTVTWEDTTNGLQISKSMSGLDYLKGIQTGIFPAPPIAAVLGMWITEISEGRVVFAMEPAEYHYNPLGTVHGGVTATIIDSAVGCTVQSVLPSGTGYTTLELKTNYLRPITYKTGIIYCAGKIIHVGGRIATAEAHVTDADGKLYAHGTTTCMLFRP